MSIGEDHSHLYAGGKRKKKKKIYTDGLVSVSNETDFCSVSDMIAFNQSNNISAVLLRGERAHSFYSEDSYTYISPYQQDRMNACWSRVDARLRFDSVHVRYVKRYTVGERYYRVVTLQADQIFDAVSQYRAALRISMTPMRMYRLSLTGAMIFGMVSMSFIYRNLGQNVFAQNDVLEDDVAVVRVIENIADNKEDINITEEDEKKSDIVDAREDAVDTVAVEKKDEQKQSQEERENQENIVKKDPVVVADIIPVSNDVDVNEQLSDEKSETVNNIKTVDSATQKNTDNNKFITQNASVAVDLHDVAYDTVKDHPIEKMLPYILEQDPEVAKYLIAIAKQESNWGKRVPVLNGQDCYNYWGYRGIRKLMGTGGHTCFNSRKDAVETVGKRIHDLIYKYDRATAHRLIVWKCGSTCDGHSQESVDRWIGVVDAYHKKLSVAQ